MLLFLFTENNVVSRGDGHQDLHSQGQITGKELPKLPPNTACTLSESILILQPRPSKVH